VTPVKIIPHAKPVLRYKSEARKRIRVAEGMIVLNR